MAIVHGLLHGHREHSAAGEGHVHDEFQAHCLDAGEYIPEEAAHFVRHHTDGGGTAGRPLSRVEGCLSTVNGRDMTREECAIWCH